jgi:hypothetical protein
VILGFYRCFLPALGVGRPAGKTCSLPLRHFQPEVQVLGFITFPSPHTCGGRVYVGEVLRSQTGAEDIAQMHLSPVWVC